MAAFKYTPLGWRADPTALGSVLTSGDHFIIHIVHNTGRVRKAPNASVSLRILMTMILLYNSPVAMCSSHLVLSNFCFHLIVMVAYLHPLLSQFFLQHV